MSDEHYKLLSTNRFRLCQFMNPRDRFIDYLISLDVFSEIDKGKVMSKARLQDMAEETVNILLRKSDCAFDKFVSALNGTNQSHVSYLLTGVGNPPMSDEHREILSAKIDELVKFTDTENNMLDRLISRLVIAINESEQIRSVTDQEAMARKLVEILLRKSDDAYQEFIASLRETGQTHVAFMLNGEGNSRPLKEEHRRRLLSRRRDDLVNEINSKSSGLITALMSKGVFSDYDEQRVTSVQPDTDYDRNELILNLIARKSQADFFNFVSALNDTGQTHVVVKLIGGDVVVKIKTVYESETNDENIPGVDAELVEYMLGIFQHNGAVVKRLNEILSQNGVAVTDVREGCIEITFTCRNIKSLNNFQYLHKSGTLENLTNDLINEAFCPQFAAKGLKSLKVEISDEQFKQCAETFARWMSMTSEHREALLSSEKSLLDKLRVSGDLLDKLSLCRRRRQAIESAATREQQVKTLIDIVSRQPDSAFTQLLNALNDTNQHEAAAVISSDSRRATKSEARKLHEPHIESAWEEVENKFALKVEISDEQFEKCAKSFPRWIPMTSEHREALLSSQKWLMDKITVSNDLLDKLSLSRRRRKAIESAATREQQVKTLIDIVSRQPDSDFTQLLNALKDTNQCEAAAIISGDYGRESRSEDRELHMTDSEDARRDVTYQINYLQHLITNKKSGYMDQYVKTVLSDIVTSVHCLREQYLVATQHF